MLDQKSDAVKENRQDGSEAAPGGEPIVMFMRLVTQGAPVLLPVLPTDSAGRMRKADGNRWLTVEQAAELTATSVDDLDGAYEMFLEDGSTAEERTLIYDKVLERRRFGAENREIAQRLLRDLAAVGALLREIGGGHE